MFLSIILFFVYAHAHIVIDIEPEELQRIGEILVESYLQNQQQQQLSNAVSWCKKITNGVIQLLGIMFTLVSANLLTTFFEPSVLTSIYTTTSINQTNM